MPFLELYEALDARAIASAHRHSLAVVQHDGVLSCRFEAYLFDVVKVHHRRAVDPQEDRGIELLFERSHGLAQQMALRLGAESNVVLLSADHADVIDGQKENPALRLEDDAAGVFSAR